MMSSTLSFAEGDILLNIRQYRQTQRQMKTLDRATSTVHVIAATPSSSSPSSLIFLKDFTVRRRRRRLRRCWTTVSSLAVADTSVVADKVLDFVYKESSCLKDV